MSNTINPNQIRPFGTNGQLLGTVAGASGALEVVAGSGITVTLVGNQIVISASAPATPLTITGFAGGQAGELGQSFVNPAFTASYTGTPTSANISNTDSIDSPHSLTTPFTSATLAGTFVHTAVATTTFTLHATDGVTSPTATQAITWEPRIFSGVGAAGGATGATASGTSAVLVGDTGTLASAGLGAEVVGQVFPFTGLTGQFIYLLLIGGSHTFIDANTGFPFAFNAPIAVSFTNQYGAVPGMYLYGCPNGLYGNFSPKVST